MSLAVLAGLRLCIPQSTHLLIIQLCPSSSLRANPQPLKGRSVQMSERERARQRVRERECGRVRERERGRENETDSVRK